MLAVAVAVSQVLAAPLAAALLKLDGLLGLAGWQWLFIAGVCVEQLAEYNESVATGLKRTSSCQLPA
jgi:hypothetical protein